MSFKEKLLNESILILPHNAKREHITKVSSDKNLYVHETTYERFKDNK